MSDLPPVITHCQIVSQELLDRVREYCAGADGRPGRRTIVANVQPQFTASDLSVVGARLLGPQKIIDASGNLTASTAKMSRLRFCYAWRSLMESGMLLCGGSDAPVEPPDALRGMREAMRNALHVGQAEGKEVGKEVGEDRPRNRYTEDLSFGEALAMYTTNAACAVGRGRELGRLEVGYRADFVVTELRDFTDLVPEEKRGPQLFSGRGESASPSLGSPLVAQTWLGGHKVFDRANAAEDGVGTGSLSGGTSFPNMPGRAGRPLWCGPARAGLPLWRCPCCRWQFGDSASALGRVAAGLGW